MNSKAKAILTLRIVCGLTILTGVIGIIGGLVANATIPVMGMAVPAWVLGASVAYMGARYWRKIPELSKNLDDSATFSWSNFRGGK
jgi:hypothetical protein